MEINENMTISNLNLNRDDSNHYKFACNNGKIFSKINNIKYNVKNIEIDICNEINVSFEMDNNDFHDLTMYNDFSGETDVYVIKHLNKPAEFKSIVIECNFKQYHINLLNFIGNMIYYESIEKPKVFGNCDYCKLIKNNLIFENNEKIKIWDIYDYHKYLNNYFCLNFKNYFLKDMTMISKLSNCPEVDIEFDETFDQIYPYDWFIYQDSDYAEYLGCHECFIENINSLLSFYTSKVLHRRMTIIESLNNNKLEILFESKNTHKLNGYSIFHPNPDNFIKFLDSSYENYLKLKRTGFNIDLLIQYYIWFKNEVYVDLRHLFGSIFLEVLIKQYYGENSSKKFATKLKYILEFELNLNTMKLFNAFEDDLVYCLKKIRKLNMGDLSDYARNINIVMAKFEEHFFVEILTRYRNKNVHAGEMSLSSQDLEDIFNNAITNTEKSLNGEKNMKIIEILVESKDQIINSYYLNNLDVQNIALENLMEVILLKLLNVDCGLSFNLKRSSINSKEYVDSLSK